MLRSTTVEITELEEAQQQLEDALTRMLRGFIVICADCKSIRDEGEGWMPIESYAARKMDFHEFSHGLCPVCFEKVSRRNEAT